MPGVVLDGLGELIRQAEMYYVGGHQRPDLAKLQELAEQLSHSDQGASGSALKQQATVNKVPVRFMLFLAGSLVLTFLAYRALSLTLFHDPGLAPA